MSVPDRPASGAVGLTLSPTADVLRDRCESARARGASVVVVQGLGFVGAAVAAVVADTPLGNGFAYFVIGLDLPTPAGRAKAATINGGDSPIVSDDPDVARLTRKAVVESGNLVATTDAAVLGLADIVIVDVPLDVVDIDAAEDGAAEIRLEPFVEAVRSIGRYALPSTLVLVETTVPFGLCERVVVPELRAAYRARGVEGEPLVAHAYERVMPGPRYVESIRRFWRTFAATSDEAGQRTRRFLESIIDTPAYPLWQLPAPTSSELAKLLENSYRATNIAFMYEWTLLAEHIGVNLFEIVDSIRVRQGTHDNMRYPGFGVGGYCLTKDSLLAQWSATELFGSTVDLAMTRRALAINRRMPLHTLDLLLEASEAGLDGATVGVCGLSYRGDVVDTRHSPAEVLVDALLARGARVIAHQPGLDRWNERPAIEVEASLSAVAARADALVFTVKSSDYGDLSPDRLGPGRNRVLVDAQDVVDDRTAAALRGGGWRLVGVGKGHWRAPQGAAPS